MCFLLKSKAGAIGVLYNTDLTQSYPEQSAIATKGSVDLAMEKQRWRNDKLLLLGMTEPELLLVSEHARLGS